MTKLINFRVEVRPVFAGYYFKKSDAQGMRDEADALLAQIKRHCDFDRADIQCDIVCEHCDSIWEWEKDFPYCCDEAQEEWAKNNPAKALPDGYSFVDGTIHVA